MAKLPIEHDYVYTDETTGEYRYANIALNTDGHLFDISITVENMMTIGELNAVLKDIERDFLKKMRQSLNEDCSVVLKHNERAYAVALEGAPARAVALTAKE